MRIARCNKCPTVPWNPLNKCPTLPTSDDPRGSLPSHIRTHVLHILKCVLWFYANSYTQRYTCCERINCHSLRQISATNDRRCRRKCLYREYGHPAYKDWCLKVMILLVQQSFWFPSSYVTWPSRLYTHRYYFFAFSFTTTVSQCPD